jgi:epoxyqueuosine reductase
MFRGTPVTRARYAGFLRNVAIAMGNRGLPQFRAPLEKLALSEDAVVAEHARWALAKCSRAGEG